jgi:hypothetical protein
VRMRWNTSKLSSDQQIFVKKHVMVELSAHLKKPIIHPCRFVIPCQLKCLLSSLPSTRTKMKVASILSSDLRTQLRSRTLETRCCNFRICLSPVSFRGYNIYYPRPGLIASVRLRKKPLICFREDSSSLIS